MLRSKELLRARLPVLGLVLVLLGTAALALPLRDRDPLLSAVSLPWWALAAGYVLAAVLEGSAPVPDRRVVAARVPGWELVTVLGLFFASPRALVLGGLTAVVLVGLRRQDGAWQLVLSGAAGLAESAIALQVLDLLAVPGDVALPGELVAADAPLTWAAAGLAVVVARAEGRWAWRVGDALLGGPEPALSEALGPQSRPAAAATAELLQSAVAAVLGLLAVLCLSVELSSAWLLLAVLAGLVLVQLHAAQLVRRAELTDRLGLLERDLHGAPGRDQALRQVLLVTRTLLDSPHVSLDIVQDDALDVRADLDAAGELRLTTAEGTSALPLEVARSGGSLIITSSTDDELEREWLHEQRCRQGVLVPVVGADRVLGALAVAGRERPPYRSADRLALGRVAEIAAAALDAHRLLDELRQQTLHDSLTGLPNRVCFRQALSDRLGTGQQHLAVGVMDLDGFKDVNDVFGHAQGDLLLQEIAQRLVAAVGEAGMVARLGGDEFALLLPRGSTDADLLRTADRVLAAIREPVVLHGLELEVGAGLGLSLAGEHGDEPGALLKHADAAMYAAKGSVSGVRVYDAELHDRDPRHRMLAGDLPAAMADRQLMIHALPAAALSDGTVVSLEALLRWEHPELGKVHPQELLPIAERAGLAVALTAYVLDSALAGWSSWNAGGLAMGVSVNVSSRSLLDEGLPKQVEALLDLHRVPASALTLEITESAALLDPERVLHGLAELRKIGVRLSLDDFGSGTSTLSSLITLPVQEVKIDRAVVSALHTRPGQARVVRAVIDLARGLQIEVVAEGIEDAQTWAELQQMGCARGQGWHLSRAMPVDLVPSWLVRAGRQARSAD